MKIWGHWQNLNDKRHGKQGSGLIHGRAWLNLGEWKFHWEWHLWSRSCGVSVDLTAAGGGGDDDILLGVAFPPVSLYFGVAFPWKSWVKKLLPKESRECSLAIHNWTIWLHPWSSPMEWRSNDPWWRRGVNLNLPDFVLGKHRYSCVETRPRQRIEIELDGRKYRGTAKFEERRWKRPRWFEKVRVSTTIDMDQGEGLPHAGKGTCSWNCGDDALYGWGVDGYDVPKAIGKGVELVLEYRQKYGMPSSVPPEPREAA